MVKEILDKYYTAVENENYTRALEILTELRVSSEELPWFYAKKAECYYELRDYQTAVSYCQKSLKKQPKYPLALWTISSAFYYLQKYNQSIKYLYVLDEMDENRIGKQETRMGITWSRSLKMDVCLKLADALYMSHNDNLAIFYYKKYREYRKRRVKSSLPAWYLKDLEGKLREIV